MHISSPINAIEDVYVTLGHFVKIKVASKIQDSLWKCRIFPDLQYVLHFESSDLHLSETNG